MIGQTISQYKTCSRLRGTAIHFQRPNIWKDHLWLDGNGIPITVETKSRHTVIDPTVNIFESMFEDRPGVVSATLAAVADRLPAQVVRRDYLSGGLPVPAGTDAIAGFSLHRELELYVEAGIPASSVLQMATLGAARVMKKQTEFGSVSAGKFADLILIDGDPSAHISDIRRAVLVLKGGAIYKPSDINRAIGVKTTSSE